MEGKIQDKKLRLIEWLLHLDDEQIIDQLDNVREITENAVISNDILV